ncbi:MAG: SigE family polymerase sigma factor [Frankiales bacterium]|nr:SigE family polymerase sigma factor [Frankiales bacterium]
MKAEDRAQLAEFISVNQAAWMRTAYVLAGGNKPSAEDLLQRALEKLVGKWPLRARMEEPALYVRRILVNLHIDAGRRRLRQQKAVGLTLVGDTRRDEYTDVDDRQQLRQALARLPARQRATLVLRYFDDLDVVSIARLMACSEGTVKSQLSRGLTALRSAIPDVNTEEWTTS